MRAAVSALLCLGLTGCSGELTKLFLTGVKMQQLEDNVTTKVEEQNTATVYGYSIGRGDVDLTGASYDPPTESNGWVGTVDFPAGSSLPFGLGAMTYIFSAMADGVSVDPYDPGVDLSNATDVFVDGVLDYTGLSTDGLPLALLADIAITSVSNQANTAVVLLDGNVNIDLNGYVTDLDVSALTATLDLVQDQVSEVTGQFQSSIDLPTEVFDAVFDMDAIGSTIDIAVQAAGSLSEFGIEL